MLVCNFMQLSPLKISACLPRHRWGAYRSSYSDWEAQYIVPLHTLHGGYWWQRKPPALVKFLQQQITSTSWPLLPVWSGRSETENAHVEISMAASRASDGSGLSRILCTAEIVEVSPFSPFPAPITSSIPYWKQRERKRISLRCKVRWPRDCRPYNT